MSFKLDLLKWRL